jgi:hypothetical protein
MIVNPKTVKCSLKVTLKMILLREIEGSTYSISGYYADYALSAQAGIRYLFIN